MPAVGPSPIDRIHLVERFERCQVGLAFTATSLPGHLIHLVLAGEVEQACNGRHQRLSPGTVVWYHEDEWVEGRVLRAPWIFYSVNFAAPTLSPPGSDVRLFSAQKSLEPIFARLLAAWQSTPSRLRDCQCQSHLLSLIAAIYAPMSGHPPATTDGKLWWEMESWVRLNIERPVSLSELCSHFGRSPNTLARACHEAVGTTPMKRLKQIRLSFARGLARYSDLNMTEIARRIGYARVHELSRDYRHAYGIPPTVERHAMQTSANPSTDL